MKNLIPQLSTATILFIALAFLMSYTRPTPMEQPKEYIIISGGNIQNMGNFQNDVNHKISEGWNLQGGVSANPNGLYMQAMVR